MVLWGYTKHDRHIAGDTHIPSDMSMGIHKPQGHPYHCDTGSKGNINFQNGHVTGVRKYKNALNSLTNRIFSQVLGKLYNFKYVHAKGD